MTEKTMEQKKHDRWLKLLSLIVAVVLWFYASAEQNPVIERHFDVPVQYINQADNLVVLDDSYTVRVKIRGKQADLAALRSDDFVASVNLEDAVVGRGEYPVVVTSGVVAERYTYGPTSLLLELEAMESKEVPVLLETTQTLPEGYVLTAHQIQPAQVTIQGLREELAEIEQLYTEPVSLANITQETVRDVALQIPKNITVKGSRSVQVRLTVEQESLTPYEAPLELRNLPENLQASTFDKVTVYLKGDSQLLSSQRELGKIRCYVDCSNITEGNRVLPVQVDYAGRLEIVETAPVSVLLHVTAQTNEQGESQSTPKEPNHDEEPNIDDTNEEDTP